jgi:hypothetical protein
MPNIEKTHYNHKLKGKKKFVGTDSLCWRLEGNKLKGKQEQIDAAQIDIENKNKDSRCLRQLNRLYFSFIHSLLYW